MLRPVQDIGLGGFGEVRRNQGLLHPVLHLLHRGDFPGGKGGYNCFGQFLELCGGNFFIRHRSAGFGNRVLYLLGVKIYDVAVSFPYLGNHITRFSLCFEFPERTNPQKERDKSESFHVSDANKLYVVYSS